MKLTMNPVTLAVVEVLTVLVLAGCGGAATEDLAASSTSMEEAERLRWRRIDSVPPSIVIEGKTAAGTPGQVGLKGTAADNMRLYRVKWANDRGGEGTAALAGSTTEAA